MMYQSKLTCTFAYIKVHIRFEDICTFLIIYTFEAQRNNEFLHDKYLHMGQYYTEPDGKGI